MSQSRQLAAIIFTDIVGFTALMGNDEQKTFEILEKNRQIQKPIISKYNGRWIKELGDGVMASFGTVTDAVNAAIKIMEACNAANEYQLCIGIHSAEVVFENDDVFGDGVNIASRIQTAAPPGCIFISESVQKNISNKKDIKTHFVREAKLKNVSHPVRLYQLLIEGSELVIPEKVSIQTVQNSIAVLPFVNMSNDPEQDFFSDGITEEIINMLAQVPDLKVIGRTSSFVFKGKNLDLKVIGKQLKVNHILEGSVRKSGKKLRITAQLIKTDDGFHLYSEKFDRELNDIFAIQDEISLAILNAIEVKLFGAKKDAVLKKYTDNFEAYQLYLKGRFHKHKMNPEGFFKAIEYFEAAIKVESEFAIAYAGISMCYNNLWSFNFLPADQSLPQVIAAAQHALELDNEITDSHLGIGEVKLHYEWNFEEAQIHYEKAVAINPNSAETHVQLAFCAVLFGRYQEALNHSSKAESLDPFSILNLFYMGLIPFTIGNIEDVSETGKKLIDLEFNFFGGHLWLALGHVFSKRFEEAIAEFEIGVKLNPGTFTIGYLGVGYGLMNEKLKAREAIKKIQDIEGAEFSANHSIGQVYASIGEWDSAYQYFDKAIENQEGQLLWTRSLLQYIPDFLEDPRSNTLLEKIGLPIK